MGIPDRVFNLAKAQLDKALTRWEEIDLKAQQEIDQFMSTHNDQNNVSAWDRALGKINSAIAAKELASPSSQIDEAALRPEPSLDELERKIAADKIAQAQSTPQAQPAQSSTVAVYAAYKVLGVQPGADLLTVQRAYQSLKERASPERFPEGSSEREAAAGIQRRIDSAYIMIGNILAPATDRFDRLEL